MIRWWPQQSLPVCSAHTHQHRIGSEVLRPNQSLRSSNVCEPEGNLEGKEEKEKVKHSSTFFLFFYEEGERNVLINESF